ncbi:hypothetical protein HJZ14_23945, partial [Vibrio parahaemolyticus]|nr:hypothetical protein [Vibrio parahaemolyticus]MBE4508166.1 hypothetical protein [Vibrio parahaemolyticus]
ALTPKEHEKTDIGGPVPSIAKMLPEMPRSLDGFEQKRKRAVGTTRLKKITQSLVAKNLTMHSFNAGVSNKVRVQI